MTIYILMEGCKPLRAFENINIAKHQLESRMFALCKQGHRIVTCKDTEYTYADPKNNSVRSTLYLTEIELQR